MGTAVDLDRLPVHVVGAPQGEVDEPGADGAVGHPVDDDEPTRVPVLRIRVEGDGPVEVQVGHADLVERQRASRHVLEGVDVDLILGLVDRGAHGGGADLDQVAASGEHVVLAHPDHVRLELVRHGRRIACCRHDIAPADVHFIFQADGDRFSGHRLGQVSVVGHDARHGGLAARGEHPDPVAWA